MPSDNKAESAFHQLAESLAHSGGVDFYGRFVQRLAAILEVDHVVLARIVSSDEVQTLAVWSAGALADNISYPLAGTPCETVIGQQTCIYPSDLQTLFPQDALLNELGAQSYLGLPLQDATGASQGLLAVMKNTPMQFARFEEEVLRIAALQVGAEIGRLQAELAAKESERRLQTLLNHLPGMAYRCLNDAAWTMLIVSDGVTALTGYRADQLRNNSSQTFIDLIHSDDRQRVFDGIQAAVESKASFSLIYRLLPLGGGMRWVQENGQVVFDDKDEVLYLEGFITDITEQYEAQRVQDAVIQIASTVTSRLGDDYFNQLLSSLTKILGADAGFIAQLDTLSTEHDLLQEPTVQMIRTVSLISQGQPLVDVSFDPAGTFCEIIIDEQECTVNQDASVMIPGLTQEAGSWIGRRLDNALGEPIGVIMVMYYGGLPASTFGTSVLRILSTGAAAELERRRDHQRMHQLAYIDSTTGLPNRANFMENLTRLRRDAERDQHTLVLLLLDIRRFKEINDTHGHSIGDQLLSAVAGRLRRAANPQEVMARLSGDEFAVLIPGMQTSELGTLIQKLRELINKPVKVDHRSFSLEVSVGSAIYPQDAVTPGELFQAASIALYHAKQKEEAISLYDPAMTQALMRDQQMAERLTKALDRGELLLYYQPQVDLPSGRLIGAEALCRWHDDEWGWVSPAEFIPLAERRGLIRRLGTWVLSEVARQLLAWRQIGFTLPGRLSINISAQQFADPDLASHITSLLATVPPSAIGLELTESDFMRDPEQAIGITQTLHNSGFSLSIDDFGTGYSSLSYLRRFSADTLKIDISFVRDILTSHHDQVIVQTIIAMAVALGMGTIAEGVETQGQAELLASMGCHQAQGYLHGRPLPASAFTEAWGEHMRKSPGIGH
ncbi:EAL domain-containing protein [Halopseudomonas pelagia]|uniref:Diguanylate cyclase n=1 Tax=Halopseudomonas pelagia TaxID=553151 RepID=A0AA91Z7Q9_9GAMM|nr:EAL domain-containing protein [Halopseudomonas pelagia]PCD00816.1 diguanylate cyclase [Halopseudomonas pelagia]QFY58106.1 EAL domain-containing protein [Halopseudomonas pelagia]